MAYVTVPRDISKFESKVAFNLTKRQLICFSIGGVLGFGSYTLLKEFPIPANIISIVMFIVMSPFFVMGIYKRNGMPFEKYMYIIIRQKYLRPQIRRYKSINLYEVVKNIKYSTKDFKKSKRRVVMKS